MCIQFLLEPAKDSATLAWFAPGSLSLELAKGLPAAFVALIVGGIAAGIAWRQYGAAKAKLKFDLFDRRCSNF
ncbi:MAG: hypothetical protein K0R08_636 [Solimicrobium sp.]|jgi:hypothetical protein|nr:hypothetical protein [Solimicrobium sp.]